MSKNVDKFLEDNKPSSGWNDSYYHTLSMYLRRFEKEYVDKCDHIYSFEGGMRGAISSDTGICGKCSRQIG